MIGKNMNDEDPIIGKVVVAVRLMTEDELDQEGMDGHSRVPVVIVFNDNTRVYASMDGEGNGPGELFGIAPDGSGFYLVPKKGIQ